jgi:hypothetical protein
LYVKQKITSSKLNKQSARSNKKTNIKKKLDLGENIELENKLISESTCKETSKLASKKKPFVRV